MRYVVSRLEKETLDKAYRIYVTDCLMLITENTAKAVAGGKSYIKRYIDFIKKEPEQDPRSGEEIIGDIKKKLKDWG